MENASVLLTAVIKGITFESYRHSLWILCVCWCYR